MVLLAAAARASATFRSTSIARCAWSEPALARVVPRAVMNSCVAGGNEAGHVDVSVEMMGWSFAVALVALGLSALPALSVPPVAEASRARREKAWTVLMDGLARSVLRM